MASLSERLNAMTIRAKSPDDQIMAVVENRSAVSVRFRPGAYEKYDKGGLEHQLARLATLAWVAYRKGYFMALSEIEGEEVKEQEETWDPRRRRFRADQATLALTGMSPRRCVLVQSTGLASWRVRVKEGTLQRLGEEDFCRETEGAVGSLLRDYRLKMAELRDKHYGTPPLPKELRVRRERQLGS